MDEFHAAPKGTTMATSALCGCIAGYIENPDGNIFFHYTPLCLAEINGLIEENVTQDTIAVHLIMPGDENGKPAFYYLEDFLGKAIEHIEGKGLEPQIHSYSTDQNFEDRYEGTAWIDSQGSLFLENRPVYSVQIQAVTVKPQI